MNKDILFGGSSVFLIINEYKDYSSTLVRYGDKNSILEIEVYDFLGRIKTIDCAYVDDLTESVINFPENNNLKLINQSMFIESVKSTKYKPFKINFNRNEMDIIISKNTNIQSYYKNSRIEYYYDENEYLCYIRVKDLTLDEYKFLKKEQEIPGQYMFSVMPSDFEVDS